jgi:hypothetical protein
MRLWGRQGTGGLQRKMRLFSFSCCDVALRTPHPTPTPTHPHPTSPHSTPALPCPAPYSLIRRPETGVIPGQCHHAWPGLWIQPAHDLFSVLTGILVWGERGGFRKHEPGAAAEGEAH